MKEAKWVWRNDEDNADEYVEFKDTFEYERGKLIFDISCDSNYALYINGVLVGGGQYADFPWYKVYDRLDITDYAARGKNELKVIVWYIGHNYFTYYKGKPGVIYELRNGEDVVAHSSEQILCRLSGNYVNCLRKEITNQILGYSFRYDTRPADGEWFHAKEVSGITYDLNPRPVKMLKIEETSFGRLMQGKRRIYDLGRERVGLLHIRFKAPAGTIVNIAFGEHLADGCVRRFINTYPLREGVLPRDYSVEVIGSGDWEEYLNPFRRLGCRYLEISADAPVEIDFIGLRETMYPVKPVPFKAENELRQKIYDTCIRTLRLCMHEHYEDCPWREQVLYVLDSRNQMLCGYYAFREYDYARASLRLLALNQCVNGLIATSAPNNDPNVIPSFSLHYIMQMREYIEHSGDLSVALEFYVKMMDTLRICVDRIEENGLIPIFSDDPTYFNFYEWSEDMQSELFRQDEKRIDIQLNCILSMALKNMEYIAGRLHKEYLYEGVYEKLNRRIDEYFYDPKTGLYHTNELGNALAVLCGAAQGERAKRVCEVLAARNNGLVPITLSMIGFKYDALLKTDKKYKEVILQDIDEKYGYMLKCGATSFWETLEGESAFNNAGSLCHGWSAMPVYYYHLFSQET